MSTLDPSPAKLPLARVIGLGGVAFCSFNTMVGSGIFGLPALAAALLGPAAILAYLVCAVLIGLVGLCFAEVGSRVSSAGGLYAYARVSLGPVAGGVAGTLLWTANSIAPNAAIANFLTDTLSVVWPALNGAVPRVLFMAAIYTLLGTVNIRGTRAGARLTVAMGLIKLTPLILLVVAGAFALKGPNLHWDGMPSIGSVGQGALLLFFAFMGIEGGLGTSGEVRNPARTIPQAILLTLTLVAALYIGLQVVAQGVLGSNLATSTAPLVATATEVFGPWGTRLFLVTTILSAAGYLTADLLSTPRSVFALADEGQLPRRLAAVHPRFGTPAAAVGIYTFCCFLAAASGSFRQLVLVASSGTLMLYLICCLGLLRLRALDVQMAGKPFRAPGGAFVPLAASAIIVWMLTTLTPREIFAALCIVAVSGIVYAIRERRPACLPLHPRSS
ncbi:MAG: APC family permease [Gammaproteobacteria bacterium]